MEVAVGVATHVVINTMLSHCESATYTVVQVLLSWSADQQALFIVSVLTAKSVFVVSVLRAKPVFVVVWDLGYSKKAKVNQFFVNMKSVII